MRLFPSIKKYGRYEIDKESAKQIQQINQELDEYKKRVKVLEDNQKKPRYPEGGYVYIVQPPNAPPNMFKIGKTGNLNKRLNTHNSALPDNMRVVHKVKTNDPTAVEHCV